MTTNGNAWIHISEMLNRMYADGVDLDQLAEILGFFKQRFPRRDGALLN